MQEDKCAERLLSIKAKIASIRDMDPSLRGSIEEIEERKRKLPMNRISIIPPRSENRTSHLQAEAIRPVTSVKKVFTLDSDYYKELHQKYERSALANINAPRNEVVPAEKMKEPEVSNEGKKEEGKEKTERPTSNINQPASLFKLQPVIQESTITEPQNELQTIKHVQQSQPVEIRAVEPQAKSPVREVKGNKQIEANVLIEANIQEQIKPLAGPLKFNHYGNPPSNPLFGKAPNTASQPLFPLDKDKKIEVKPLGLFSQKYQPVNLSQVKGDIIKHSQNVGKPPTSNFKIPQITLSFPHQIESSKPPLLSFLQPNPQKIISPWSQQAPAAKQLSFPADTPHLFGKQQEKQPQATQPQQKKTRLLQGLYTSSQQVTPTNALLNSNETQKPKGLFFGDSQQQKKPLFQGNIPPPPNNSGPSLLAPSKSAAGFFSSNSSNEKPAIESKPITFIPSFAPAKIQLVASSEIKTEGLFQKKTTFGDLPATPFLQGGIFSNNNANNPLKVQPKHTSPQNNQPRPFQNKQTTATIHSEPEKALQKEEKKEKTNMSTIIGPGGKKLEMPAFSTGEAKKINLFGSISNPMEIKNVFSQPSSTPSVFPNSFFQVNTGTPGISSQPQPTGQTGNIFATSNNIYASTLFNCNQPKAALVPGNINILPKTGENEEEQGDQGEDEGPQVAEDDANPNLSTGKFDYVKTQVHFKESAVKFKDYKEIKEGNPNDAIENITVSIQSFENSQDRYLYIRLANKCIAFSGKFVKETVTRPLNNTDKNVEVKMILRIKDNVASGFALLRIQFKEESVGTKFLKEANVPNATG